MTVLTVVKGSIVRIGDVFSGDDGQKYMCVKIEKGKGFHNKIYMANVTKEVTNNLVTEK